MSDKNCEGCAALRVVVEDARKAVTKPIGSILQPEHPDDKLYRYGEMLICAVEILSRAATPEKALAEVRAKAVLPWMTLAIWASGKMDDGVMSEDGMDGSVADEMRESVAALRESGKPAGGECKARYHMDQDHDHCQRAETSPSEKGSDG